MNDNGNGNGNGNGTGNGTDQATPTTTTPSFLTEAMANIKWIGIGAVVGFLGSWLLRRRR